MVAALSEPLVVEVDNDRCRNWYSGAIGRLLRGRLDFHRVQESESRKLIDRFPNGIPGERIGIDAGKGTAWFEEPLRATEMVDTRVRLEKAGYSVGEARKEIDSPDIPTLLHTVKLAAQAGIVRVVSGKVPEKIEGKIRTSFYFPDREDPRDEKLKALEDQNRKLMALLVAALPADKRAAAQAIVNS